MPVRSTLYTWIALAVLAITAQAQTISYPPNQTDAQIIIQSPSSFGTPAAIAVAPDKTIYLVDSASNQVLRISQDGTQSAVDFSRLSHRLQAPSGLAVSRSGDLYVTDRVGDQLIKVPAGSAAALSILSGTLLNQPYAVAVDNQGNLAISNAGNASVTARRAGGSFFRFNTGTTQLGSPTGVAFDSKGQLYVLDHSAPGTGLPAVYQFPKLGGTGTPVISTGVSLPDINGLAIDPEDNIYLLDGQHQKLVQVPANHANPSFLIPQTGFHSPAGLAIDPEGNPYVTDTRAGVGTVTRFFYNSAADFGAVALGSYTRSVTFNFDFYQPTTVTAIRGVGGGRPGAEYLLSQGGTCTTTTYHEDANTGSLPTPESCNLNVRFQPSYVGARPGAVELITSNGTLAQPTVGTGLGAQLAFAPPTITKKYASLGSGSAVTLNPASTKIYVADTGRQAILVFPVSGGAPVPLVTGIATPDPVGVAVSGLGDVFVLNQAPAEIIKVPADGSAASILPGTGLKFPVDITIDPFGNLYVADQGTQNQDGFITRIAADGTVSHLPGSIYIPQHITADSQGNIYFTDLVTQLLNKVSPGTYAFTSYNNITIGGAGGSAPTSLTVDASGTLYFYDVSDAEGMYSVASPTAQLVNLPLNYTSFPPPSPVGELNSLVVGPDSRLYGVDRTNLYRIDRSQGTIGSSDFTSGQFGSVGGPLSAEVFNVGNLPLQLNNPSAIFSESGAGVGSFTFTAQTCSPQSVLAPGGECTFGVSNPGSAGSQVTDTLRFFTNAVNTKTASYVLTGSSNTAP